MVLPVCHQRSSLPNQIDRKMPSPAVSFPGKRLLHLFCFLCWSQVTWGQHSWMHPDDHIRAPHYLEWIEALENEDQWTQARLLTTLPNGRIVDMSAHAQGQGGQSLIHINGDMRWVVSSEEPLSNLSASLVEGYNGGSLDFMWHNHLHSLGGYGLWRRHFDLIRFHGGDQGWQKVATDGQSPEDQSNTDMSMSFFAHGKAHLFVDPLSSRGFTAETNFVYHVLDLDKRQWTRKGAVDARLGQIRGGINLPSGWLMHNEAGELIWVDFEQEIARLLPNAAGMLEEFYAWHREEGRMTFVGDSTVWHLWNGERVTLNIPWKALDAAQDVPLFVPSSLPLNDNSMAAGPSVNGRERGTTFNLSQLIPWLMFLGLAIWFWLERRKSSRRREGRSPQTAAEELNEEKAQGQYSALTQMVLEHMGKQFETEELDVLLGISHLSSPETLRSHRARMIQRVNTEYRVTQGQDLIVRQRAFSDRRRSVYVIGGTPGAAAQDEGMEDATP